MIGDLIRTPPVSCQATCSQLPGRTFTCAPCPIGQSQSSGASVECTSLRWSSATETPPVGNSPKVVDWLCGIFPPKRRKHSGEVDFFGEFAPRLFGFIKTKILGCQINDFCWGVFWTVVFFGGFPMKVRVPCGSEVSYAWMVNTRSRDGEIGGILILSLAISAISYSSWLFGSEVSD